MRKILFVFIVAIGLAACKKETENINYRQEMRKFVQAISTNAKSQSPGFIVIPQNGLALLMDGDTTNANYISAIDGVGREELFYGYNNNDNTATPVTDETINWLTLCKTALTSNKQVLVTDYCTSEGAINDSYSKNFAEGFISFAATHRELDNIPSYPSEPFAINNSIISSLGDAKSFLYIISHSDEFADKQSFLNALAATKYDVIIMDAFFNDKEAYTSTEINSLKAKANGGARKVIAYMSIGEAETYRYYWNTEWEKLQPNWLLGENPQWAGNFKVKYWDKNWQNIIYGSANSYLQLIVNSGFDGVYLDIVEAYEYFED
jgi:cysteinyl-tRNA synthetase